MTNRSGRQPPLQGAAAFGRRPLHQIVGYAVPCTIRQ
jgi:hypothetical protein